MKSLILLAVSVTLLGIISCLQGFVNIKQTMQIGEMQKSIRCLEFGRVYVGDDFCAEYEDGLPLQETQ